MTEKKSETQRAAEAQIKADDMKYPWTRELWNKPNQRSKAIDMMKECLNYLFDDEIDAGKPNHDRPNENPEATTDMMDIRACWGALKDGEYDRAAELATTFDRDIKAAIEKITRMRG